MTTGKVKHHRHHCSNLLLMVLLTDITMITNKKSILKDNPIHHHDMQPPACIFPPLPSALCLPCQEESRRAELCRRAVAGEAAGEARGLPRRERLGLEGGESISTTLSFVAEFCAQHEEDEDDELRTSPALRRRSEELERKARFSFPTKDPERCLRDAAAAELLDPAEGVGETERPTAEASLPVTTKILSCSFT